MPIQIRQLNTGDKVICTHNTYHSLWSQSTADKISDSNSTNEWWLHTEQQTGWWHRNSRNIATCKINVISIRVHVTVMLDTRHVNQHKYQMLCTLMLRKMTLTFKVNCQEVQNEFTSQLWTRCTARKFILAVKSSATLTGQYPVSQVQCDKKDEAW